MNFAMDTTVVLETIVAGLVLYAIKGISAINGSVRTLNEWRVNHEKLDDERHQQVLDSLDDLRLTTRKLRPEDSHGL